MRMRSLSVGTGVVALAAISACRAPDLSPLRADLVRSAAIVCAEPPARPPHAPRTREVWPPEVAVALVQLCDAAIGPSVPPPGALDVLHDALLQDRATTGNLRRSPAARAIPAYRMFCDTADPRIDGAILSAAKQAREQGRVVDALDRCADVVALARDEDLTGDVGDVAHANSHILNAVETCLPFVPDASKEAAAKLFRSLTTLRATFPATLDNAIARDRAEQVLRAFGPARAPETKLACERAEALATFRSPRLAGSRSEQAELLRSWQTLKPPDENGELATQREAYTLTLAALDRLTALAQVQAR